MRFGLSYSNMNFSLLLMHSRPRFWHYLFGPMLVLMAYFLQWWFSSYIWWIVLFILFFFTTFVWNLFVYGINDYYDGDTDRFNKKKNGYEQQLNQPVSFLYTMLLVQVVYLIVAIGIFVYVGLTVYEIIYSLLVPVFLFYTLARIYSAPPVRAKARPFMDGITNLLYIIIPFSWYAWTTIAWGWIVTSNFWYALTAAWLRCMAMHCFSAIPDIEPDTKAWLRTTAVVLEEQWSLLYCIMLYAVAGLFASQVLGVLWSLLGLVYCSMMLLWFRYDMFRIYKRFPLVNFVVGMMLCFWIYFVL